MKSLLITVIASLTLFGAAVFTVHQTPAPERMGAKFVLRINPAETPSADRLPAADELQTSATNAQVAASDTPPDGRGDPSSSAPADAERLSPSDAKARDGSSPWDAAVNDRQPPYATDNAATFPNAGERPGAPADSARETTSPVFDKRFDFPRDPAPLESNGRQSQQDLALAPGGSPASTAFEPSAPSLNPNAGEPSAMSPRLETADTGAAQAARAQPSTDEWRASTVAQPTTPSIAVPPLPRKRAQSQPPISRDASSSVQPGSEIKTAVGEQRNAAETSTVFAAVNDAASGAKSLSPMRQNSNGPRIAIIIRDLGLDERETYSAINSLRPEITLAFSPYGRESKGWALRAKQSGHEVFIGVPMEPSNIAVSDAAPNMLLASLPANENMKRLDWVLSQIDGYQGVINMMGGKLAQTPDAIRPFMQTVKERGIAYVDDGAAAHPYAIMLAAQLDVRYRVADGKIGVQPSSTGMQRELQELEQIAKTKGTALGVASADPETLRQLVVWSAALPAKNITLVPASQIVSALKLQ